MDFEKEIKDLKTTVGLLNKKRYFFIPVVTAIIAALTSVGGAVIAYKSSSDKLSSQDRISADKHVIEIFSKFGDHIVKGTKEEKCTALLLVGSIQPTFEIKDRTKDLASQINCDGINEALSSSKGKTCGDRVRITSTTKSRLSRNDLNEATSMCVEGIEIPERYEGPWPDGTVTFYYGKTSANREVWCNCVISE